MILRDARHSELPALTKLLIESIEIDLDLEVVAEEKLFGPGFGGPARCRVALEDDAARGIAVTCGSSIRLLVVEPGFRRRGIGSALFDDSLAAIRQTSSRAAVGAAAGNYLVPGVPVELKESIRFLSSRGFTESGGSADMVTSLSAAERPERDSRAEIATVDSLSNELEHRLTAEFGRAIAWEIGHGLLSDQAIVRIARSEGAIVGFTACEINNAGLGTFGPQGVIASHRGKGLGTLLLKHSLADLRNLGYEAARIPWVSSTDYYRKACGADVAGEYVIMRREL